MLTSTALKMETLQADLLRVLGDLADAELLAIRLHQVELGDGDPFAAVPTYDADAYASLRLLADAAGEAFDALARAVCAATTTFCRAAEARPASRLVPAAPAPAKS